MHFALTLLFAVSLAADNPNPWELVDDDDGIKVWARAVPGSEIREVKAIGQIAAPAKRVWDTICDVDRYTIFMPYVEKTKVLGKHDKGHYEYQRVNPPFVDRRDYTLKITLEVDEAKGRYRRSWMPANDKGPAERKDSVRVKVNEGYWLITAVGPSTAETTYYLYTDPGGSIPNWLINKGNTTSVPDLLRAVRNRSINPKWRR